MIAHTDAQMELDVLRSRIRIAESDRLRSEESYDASLADFTSRIESLERQRDDLMERRENAPEIIDYCNVRIREILTAQRTAEAEEKIRDLMQQAKDIREQFNL